MRSRQLTHNTHVTIVMLMLLMSTTLLTGVISGCPAVGVADPIVKSYAGDAMIACQVIYDNSEDAEIVVQFASMAAAQLDEMETAAGESLTPLDREKVKRVRSGLQDIVDHTEPAGPNETDEDRLLREAYIRQRAKSLRSLISSINEFEPLNADPARQLKEELNE